MRLYVLLRDAACDSCVNVCIYWCVMFVFAYTVYSSDESVYKYASGSVGELTTANCLNTLHL